MAELSEDIKMLAKQPWFSEMMKELGYEKKRRWIPVTEEKPPRNKHILVTYMHGKDDFESSELDYGMSMKCNTWHWRHVIAWQPMPEPYKGEEQT